MVINMIIAFILSFAISLVITPLTIKLAYKVGAIDIPKDERRMHNKPIPRIGGLSFIIAFFLASLFLVLFFRIDNTINFVGVNLWGFYAGAIIIALTGFIDDVKDIKPLIKLLGQILAAVCVVLSGIRIGYVNIPFIELYGLTEILSITITILWIVGVTNAINLIDGLDGLATGVSAISTLSLLIIFLLNGASELVIVLVISLLRWAYGIFTI